MSPSLSELLSLLPTSFTPLLLSNVIPNNPSHYSFLLLRLPPDLSLDFPPLPPVFPPLPFLSLAGFGGLLHSPTSVSPPSSGVPLRYVLTFSFVFPRLDPISLSSSFLLHTLFDAIDTTLPSLPPDLAFPEVPIVAFHSSPLTLPRHSPSTTQKLASLFGPLPSPPSPPISLPAVQISPPLDFSLISNALLSVIHNRIRDALGSLEEGVLSKILDLVSRIYHRPYSLHSHPHSASDLQELYETVENDLQIEFSSDPSLADDLPHNSDLQSPRAVMLNHTLELVEQTISVELYDRLFGETGIQDDLDLSLKITHLNSLPITLDHLGLDLDQQEIHDPDSVAAICSAVEDMVQLASTALSRLQHQECRCPRDKVGVYVSVHKLIVDGLSSLPKIPIRRDSTLLSGAFPAPHNSDPQSGPIEVEMSETPPAAQAMARVRGDDSSRDGAFPSASPLRKVNPTQPSPSELMDAIHTDLIDPPPPQPSSDLPLQDQPVVQPPSPSNGSPLPSRPSSSSADLILPILIYLIIKANPPRLLSNLTFVTRYRYKHLIRGETDYCLVNFTVACEFIKNLGSDGSFSELNSSSQPLPLPAEHLTKTITSTSASATHHLLGPRHPHQSQGSKGAVSGRVAGTGPTYGTFSLAGSGQPSISKEKAAKEVEEVFIAASRVVSGALVGGYQKMLSGSLLEGPAARLGLASGGPGKTPPSTLEDVKRLIGSGSPFGRREGSLAGWGSRVGLLRRGGSPSTIRRPSQTLRTASATVGVPPAESALEATAVHTTDSHGSSSISAIDVRNSNKAHGVVDTRGLAGRIRTGSLHRHQPTTMGLVSSKAVPLPVEFNSAVDPLLATNYGVGGSHQLDHLTASHEPDVIAATGDLGHGHSGEGDSQKLRQLAGLAGGHQRTPQRCPSPPVERFERCGSVNELSVGELDLLLKEYQRMCVVARQCGAW